MAEQEKVFPKPVDFDELYPGRFIKSADFRGGKPTMTMTEVDIKEIEGNTGKQIKGVVRFKGKDKAWLLNKTNGLCLKAMFGRKPQQDWVGKRVTLYAAPYEGEEAIRVWGSPDIDKDMVVDIQLPRKRPFKMTMHKVVPNVRPVPGGGAPAKAPTDINTATATLRAAADTTTLTNEFQRISDEYSAVDVELPLEIEAAFNECRESMEN